MEQYNYVFPEILENVFEYLDVKTLLNCRLVSNIWNEEGRVALRKKSVQLTFTSRTQIEEFLKMFESRIILQNERQKFLNKENNIYTNFEFKNIEIDLNEQLVESFFQNVGPVIRSLKFTYEYEFVDRPMIKIRDLREISIFYTANLEELNLAQMPHEGIFDQSFLLPGTLDLFGKDVLKNLKRLWLPVGHPFASEFLDDFFSLATNLREILIVNRAHWVSFFSFKDSFIPALFNACRHLKHVTALTFFVSEDLRVMWDVYDCKNFQKLNLPLESLKLQIGGTGRETRIGIFNMIGSFSRIKYLTLRIEEILCAPTMQNLTRLTLNEYHYSLECLDEMPNLRHLDLIYYFPPLSGQVAPRNPPRLIHLDLHETPLFPTSIFQEILHSFKDLKSFAWNGMEDEKFHVICTELLELEELNVNVVDVTDWGVTGLSDEELNSNFNNLNFITRENPYIGNLKKVRKLLMNGGPINQSIDYRVTDLTDKSFIFGISQLDQLTSLTFKDFGNNVSNSTLEQIANLNLVYLQTDLTVFSSEAVEHLKEKHKTLLIESYTNKIREQITDYHVNNPNT